MNKYQKQFESMLKDQLKLDAYDKECSEEKCMGCSSEGCPFKKKLQEEYFVQIISEKAGLSEEEKNTLLVGMRNHDQELITILKQLMEETK